MAQIKYSQLKQPAAFPPVNPQSTFTVHIKSYIDDLPRQEVNLYGALCNNINFLSEKKVYVSLLDTFIFISNMV